MGFVCLLVGQVSCMNDRLASSLDRGISRCPIAGTLDARCGALLAREA